MFGSPVIRSKDRPNPYRHRFRLAFLFGLLIQWGGWFFGLLEQKELSIEAIRSKNVREQILMTQTIQRMETGPILKRGGL